MQTQTGQDYQRLAHQSTATGSQQQASPAAAIQMVELWRGAWVIFGKHLYKFTHSGMEIGGTLGWPLLWIGFFGLGMQRVVDPATIGFEGAYLAFITPGIIALTALSAAVNGGMVLLEEKITGILKEYFVAPIPQFSILLAHTGSGLVKSTLQSLILLSVAVLFGAGLRTSPAAWLGGLCFLALYILLFVGFSNGIAARSHSIGAYHMLLFLLNLPLLFLSNALYPLSTMPAWMRGIAYLNPTTYAVDGLRQTLFGSGELPLWLSAVVLLAFAVPANWFGLRSFRRITAGHG